MLNHSFIFFLASVFLFTGVSAYSGGYDPQTQSSAPSQAKLRDYAASKKGVDLSEFIVAKCVVKKQDLPQLATPCPPLKFRLLDAQGKELRQVLSQYGELKLRVEEKRDYFLVLDSAKFQTSKEKYGPLHAGDSTIVEVQARQETIP